MNTPLNDLQNIQYSSVFVLFLIVVIADLFLKGYALWLSALNKQKAWFVCIFIFNTLGILPLIYILINRSRTK